MTTSSSVSKPGDVFRLGLNYWPARTAMGWWTDFDAAEVEADFAKAAAAGFDSIRIFLTWEDFQPAPGSVDPSMLRRLITVADLALDSDVAIMPTLFTGHMSGVNWIPGWALSGGNGHRRFRLSTGGGISSARLRNWYADPDIRSAQVLMAARAASALAGHPSLWAWDLGNENSNCVVPANRDDGRRWLHEISEAIRREDASASITLGLHMEDLEEDRNIGPAEAAEVCDFLTMHGYPMYASWAETVTDEHVLPFLALMTRWLGAGAAILFSEFGAPTVPQGVQPSDGVIPVLVDEQAAAAYTGRALGVLRAVGCIGAMIWCHADYEEEIWGRPPFDEAIHERSFGVWRADGTPKPSLDVVRRFHGSSRVAASDMFGWIDIGSGEFYANPQFQLGRLYGRYRQAIGLTSG
ncbi:MAG: cellulase family glycosylhydrolase [Acidimicrobiia bacterium]|nr:cellulase family glycosylhydrolase [Acidimicrobiia bacterium]